MFLIGIGGSPAFLWYQAFKFAAKNAPKVGSHLNRANIEGWINLVYRSKDAVSLLFSPEGFSGAEIVNSDGLRDNSKV